LAEVAAQIEAVGRTVATLELDLREPAAAAKVLEHTLGQRAFLQQAGIARFGIPADIAELMAFLVSPGVRWMTGTVLRMDGGEANRSDGHD
jgi:3-oxoacyl-[acyl-carrier protein] reductase